MNPKIYTPLRSRAVLAVKGEDAKGYLQGILTNDITRLSPQQPLYALMLSPQGKFLFEMFLVEAQDGTILLDIEAARKDALLKRLMMYKLRSKVEIVEAVALAVYAIPYGLPALQDDAGIIYADPRKPSLGSRALLMENGAAAYLAQFGLEEAPAERYEELRIAQGVPDASDMEADKSFPLHYRMDELHAIDFEKGCYVGQEVTTRTKHRGVVRRATYPIVGNANLPPRGTPVMSEGKQVGELCSNSGAMGLALLEHEAVERGTPIEASGIQLTIA